MTGAQDFGHGNACHRTCIPSKIQRRLAKDVLPDALSDHAFDFGAVERQLGQFFFELRPGNRVRPDWEAIEPMPPLDLAIASKYRCFLL